jgi:broad specificity phosphatase PhoE
MGHLVLVRHGQASFGSADYDRLSARGVVQCAHLGRHFKRTREAGFAAVMRGTLRRHRQSLEAIAGELPGLPDAIEWPGLNEYDSSALIEAIHPDPIALVAHPGDAKAHFRLLREALLAWMAGSISPRGMPTYEGFVAGVEGALQHARDACKHGDVLIVSSGGPISTAVSRILQTPPTTAVALNMRLRNSALCELSSTAQGYDLISFNALPHIRQPDEADLVTHA